MAKYDNFSVADVERAAESILDNGGNMSSYWENDHIHNSAYSRDKNQHLSWDEYPDGSIKHIYTDKGNRLYAQYSN